MLVELSIITSLCISIVSLIIAILSYRLKTPKIKILIMDKEFDCFFGNARYKHNEEVRKSRISGIRLWLINNSPNEIIVLGIALKCKKETYRLINCTNEYWKIVKFIFPDENNEESTDGIVIYYGNDGVSLPLNLRAYEGKDFVALFHNFPVNIKEKARAKIIIQTTFGVKIKYINLIEYYS